jgi:hypothetical protein
MKLTEILFEAVIDIHEQSVFDDIKKGVDNFYGNSIPTASPAGLTPQGVVAMDPHVVNSILGFMLAFAPEVGPVLSTTVGLLDAKKYHDEGNDKMATIVGVLSMLPILSSVAYKIPGIKELGNKGMDKLADKLFRGSTKYTQAEARVINGINLNKDVITIGVKQYTKEQLAKEAVSKGLMQTQQNFGQKGIEYMSDKFYDFLKNK